MRMSTFLYLALMVCLLVIVALGFIREKPLRSIRPAYPLRVMAENRPLDRESLNLPPIPEGETGSLPEEAVPEQVRRDAEQLLPLIRGIKGRATSSKADSPGMLPESQVIQ